MALPDGADEGLRQWQTQVAELALPPPVAFLLNPVGSSFDAILVNPSGTEVTLTKELFHNNLAQYNARVAMWRTLWDAV